MRKFYIALVGDHLLCSALSAQLIQHRNFYHMLLVSYMDYTFSDTNNNMVHRVKK